ncbi:LLM class flavin-dependent oxidoreductase [Amycolatopsis sp. DSM 110486]|uniref:LLM class flavin-dependent oxidoreductase n=1 Tax=Amycolatopsis sp. DSM 110486 TaxID=2865832 RepID=UPI001C6A0002|nr:LLM class flavin-dependent oxidoreductase [Amycolatopsis sp. DSM 110486]QYN23031.1 LLM class flavin-dependent oxidoreductase [Amycolatopsis sp. DSM 110486]
MRIGIGIPNTVPGTSGPLVLEWARRAEERGFAFVSTIGRVAYPSLDSLTALAGVAGATSGIGLVTNAVLGPTYPDAVLAKVAGTVASLSEGRLTLGLGVGARESDYLPAERDFAGRGAAFDRQLSYLKQAWRGEAVADGDFPGEKRAVVPEPPGIPILIGGHSKRAVRRTVEHAAGWTGAGGGPARAEPTVREIRDAWAEAGRVGEPRLLGLAYFSAAQPDSGDEYLRSYYAYAGDHADTIADGAVRTPEKIRAIVRDFEAAGLNELTFTPTVADPDEVDRLADLVL